MKFKTDDQVTHKYTGKQGVVHDCYKECGVYSIIVEWYDRMGETYVVLADTCRLTYPKKES